MRYLFCFSKFTHFWCTLTGPNNAMVPKLTNIGMRSCSSPSSYLVHQEKKHFRATHSHGVTGSGRPLVWNSSDWDGFKLVLRPKTNYSPPLSKKTKLIATLCFVYISHLAFVIKKNPTNTKIKMSKTCRLSRAISWRQPWLMRDTDFGEILPSASFWSKMIAGSTFAHFKGKIVFD